MDMLAMLGAEDLTLNEILLLAQKEGLRRKESLAAARFYLKELYCLTTKPLIEVHRLKARIVAARVEGAIVQLNAEVAGVDVCDDLATVVVSA